MSSHPPSSQGKSESLFDAALVTQTAAAGTLWLTQTPAWSIWKGNVGTSDYLRLEQRDGSVEELELSQGGKLTLGRARKGVAERPDVAHRAFVSSRAATLTHDGFRWWLARRPECHERVPTRVGNRGVSVESPQPLVHGTFFQVGKARGILVDHRYSVASLPAGVVDPQTGFLAWDGMEQQLAGMVEAGHQPALLLLKPSGATEDDSRYGGLGNLLRQLHREAPRVPLMRHEGMVVACGTEAQLRDMLGSALPRLQPEERARWTGGLCPVTTEVADAAKALLLASHLAQLQLPPATSCASLSAAPGGVQWQSPQAVVQAASPASPVLLLGIEDLAQLAQMGSRVLPALENELLGLVHTEASRGSAIARLSKGVIGVVGPDKTALLKTARNLQQRWHDRPPLTHGKLDVPRSLSFELAAGEGQARADELSAECASAEGSLSALGGGFPFPIAARLRLAMGSQSQLERLKLLFDVVEAAWRMLAYLLLGAHFAAPSSAPAHEVDEALRQFLRAHRSRNAYPLGLWRGLARILAPSAQERKDAIALLARELLSGGSRGMGELERLANHLHPQRNRFAHNVYAEAQAKRDLPEFEAITRSFLRALRPLRHWSLIRILATEADPFGESQTLEYQDFTGPLRGGNRRRVRLNAPLRLAPIVYLARLRDGLVLPLEPWLRIESTEGGDELIWCEHLPSETSAHYGSPTSPERRKLPLGHGGLPPRYQAWLEQG